jgi:hypothetical protein
MMSFPRKAEKKTRLLEDKLLQGVVASLADLMVEKEQARGLLNLARKFTTWT